MKLTFLGATHEVTGSCTLIEVGGVYGIVDCGMEQGRDIFVNRAIPVAADKLDFVLLTHAHIDHSGNLPLLYKNGYTGSIFATPASCMLCDIMLRDCAHIQESEAEYKTRKAKRKGEKGEQPVYTLEDAQEAISHLRPVEYGETVQVAENVFVRFVDAGHLLGSSSIEVWLTEDGVTKKVVFSGDIGNFNQPIINDPQYIKEADYVITESTYGDRYHADDGSNSIKYLADCIQRTLDRGGNVIIPAFAVGRTQEMLYFIREIKLKGLVKGHGEFPVYVDSPLANEATGIFLQCDRDCFDPETKKLLDAGVNPLMSPNLKLSVSTEESKLINSDKEPKVIISASGMCDAGRIRHHLKYNLWRSECTVLFVGYQSLGTTGRAIIDGAKSVKLFGDDIAVKAEIAFLPGKSGHADKNGLIKWITSFENKPDLVFVNHGDDACCQSYADCLMDEYGFNTLAPYSGTSYDLLEGKAVKLTRGVPVYKKSENQVKNDSVFAKLLDACERLASLARSIKEHSNKELERMTQDINNLINKYR